MIKIFSDFHNFQGMKNVNFQYIKFSKTPENSISGMKQNLNGLSVPITSRKMYTHSTKFCKIQGLPPILMGSKCLYFNVYAFNNRQKWTLGKFCLSVFSVRKSYKIIFKNFLKNLKIFKFAIFYIQDPHVGTKCGFQT